MFGADATRKITEFVFVGCFHSKVRATCQERHGQHGGFVCASMSLAGPGQCRRPQAVGWSRRLWAHRKCYSAHLNNTISLSDMGLLNSRTTVTRTMPCTSWMGRSCAESGWSSNMPVDRAETETSTVGVAGVAGAVSAVFYRIFSRLLFRVKGRCEPTWSP